MKTDFPSTRELVPGEGSLHATFETNRGNFTAELYEDVAPMTVANFVGLSIGKIDWTDPRTGTPGEGALYDGGVFHRVISGFMIQGGDPTGTGMGGPGYRFADECSPKAQHDAGGVLSMANAGPGTNGSQFFVTLGPTPHLNGRHTVFGKVVEGLDVVESIGKTETNAADRPLEDVVIQRISVSRK